MKINKIIKTEDASTENALNGFSLSFKNEARSAFPHSLRGSQKGYVYTLEVMIAVGIVLVAIALLFNTAQVPQSSNLGLIKRQGYEALEFLEQNETLRALVRNDDASGIENRVKGLVPTTVDIEIDVCTTQCSGDVPENQNVVIVDYYVSGYVDEFLNRKVRMWMWGIF